MNRCAAIGVLWGVSAIARHLLRQHLDHQPARLATWFTPLFHWIVGTLAVAVVILLVMAHVQALHEVRAARQEVCAAKLEAWKLRNPALAKTLLPLSDACSTLGLLVDDGPIRPR